MSETPVRLYHDLAWLWPLWGDPTEEYADWCAFVTRLIQQYAQREVQTLLNLGCGGGKNAFNLRTRFSVTGIDISEEMLAQAKALNPDCTFLAGDMRNCWLGQEYDAVLIDDAISYMTNQADLSAVFQTAHRHLRPGGVMVVSPDETKETFEQNCTRVSYASAMHKPDSIDVVFIENDYDPDPTDSSFEGTMIYLIREDGKLRVETDHHSLGLFPLAVWRSTLCETGFEIHEETYVEDRRDYVTFACVKSGPSPG
jgi:SAM-dependent methyltransferase